MPRPKSVPDQMVQTAIAALYGQGGDKAVTFATVAAETGLAPPTLVQRYQSRDAMLEWALSLGWEAVETATQAALPLLSSKGEAAFLKAIAQGIAPSFSLPELAAAQRSAALQARALAWRETVERHLARSYGTARDAEKLAAMTFAAWQGQLLWDQTGGKGFKLRDAVRRLR